MTPSPKKEFSLSEKEWKERLSPEEFHVLREAGTERPFSGKYTHHHEKGTYSCAGCGQVLFDSSQKFDSGSGWPSFSDLIDANRVILQEDYKLGTPRIEVLCASCKGHLGHLFDDGPRPTRKRYCMNSVALKFNASTKS